MSTDNVEPGSRVTPRGYSLGVRRTGDGGAFSGSAITPTSEVTFDSSRVVPTDVENRPYNFNSKWYIKV